MRATLSNIKIDHFKDKSHKIKDISIFSMHCAAELSVFFFVFVSFVLNVGST